jgi:hypothetical protein
MQRIAAAGLAAMSTKAYATKPSAVRVQNDTVWFERRAVIISLVSNEASCLWSETAISHRCAVDKFSVDRHFSPDYQRDDMSCEQRTPLAGRNPARKTANRMRVRAASARHPP